MAAPTIITAFSSAHVTNADVSGVVSSNGGKTITSTGFNYGTTTGYGQSVAGSLPSGGSFLGNIPSLLPNTLYHWRAFAVNADGTGVGDDSTFTTGYAASTCTTDTYVDGLDGSFVLYGTPTYAGGGTITDQGVVWSETETDPRFSNASHNSVGAGTVGVQFGAVVAGLTIGHTYYTRAYTLNESSGTPAYGSVITLTLVADAPPTVTTQAVGTISIETAVGNGTVTSAGNLTITERGVVWSTSANPTTSDSKSAVSGQTGAFTAPLTGLAANTLYHVRAYAINADGTAYGSDVTFTTLNSTIRQTVSADITSGSGATSWPAATLAGSLIVVFVLNLNTSGHTTTVTDSAGNTYTKADTNGTVVTQELWYTANAAAATSITVDGTPSNTFERAFIAREYTGIRATTPLDQLAHDATGTSTSISSGATASTTVDKELVVGAVFWNATGGSGSVAAGSGYSALAQQATSGTGILGMEDTTVLTQGAQTATFTGGGSGPYFTTCFVATFIYLEIKVVFPDTAFGTGSAHNAAAQIAAPAEIASGTGAAYGASTVDLATAGIASGTGSANNATPKIVARADVASGTGIAFDAKTQLTTAQPATATGVGTAHNAAVFLAATAGIASGTGTAANAVPSVAAVASVAAGVGQAFGSFAILPDQTFAIATVAPGVGEAFDPTPRIIASASVAEGAGVAYDVPVVFPAFVGTVSLTATPGRRRVTVTVTRPRTATVTTRP